MNILFCSIIRNVPCQYCPGSVHFVTSYWLKYHTIYNVISVPSAPTITKPTTTDRVVLDGQEQTLQCDAEGLPKPVVTWYKNGQQLKKKQCTTDPGSCQEVYEVSDVGDGSPILTEGRLKIVSALNPRDNGEFKCVASNGNSPTAELIFNLNVTGMWDRMTLILF